INWRFFASPEPFRFYLVRREQRVVGYVVTKMTENRGEQVGSICDFVCKGDDENTAYTILYLALQELTNAGADYVELYCAEGNNYWNCVRRLGFRAISSIPIMVYAGTPIGRAIANGSGSWHFTLADCDAV